MIISNRSGALRSLYTQLEGSTCVRVRLAGAEMLRLRGNELKAARLANMI